MSEVAIFDMFLCILYKAIGYSWRFSLIKNKIKKNSYLILSYGFHLQYKLNRFTKQMVHWVLYTCICNKNKSYTIRTTKYAFQMIDCLITYQF